MRIAVIGTGHVGLITCVSMAKIGHAVVGVDMDAAKIGLLQTGMSPFFEPGVEELLQEATEARLLSFTTDTAEAVNDAEVIFICVGTPARATGEANLIAVEQAALEVAAHAKARAVLVEKSTVPAGTARRLRQMLAQIRDNGRPQLEVVSNPEFLREGRAVQDSLEPDRILVGAESEWATATMRLVYKPLTDRGYRLIETDIATAELAKHACNAFLSTKISFANALARLCEAAGADVTAVADVMGSDPRIGRAFLDAGLGYGGYCFPKDIQAFERLSSRFGYDFGLLREVSRINDEAVDAALQKIEDSVWNLEGKRIALLGLSFKPGTDDVRFSPALSLARRLQESGCEVVGHDPHANVAAEAEVPGLSTTEDVYSAVEGAHCMVVCTDWPEFRDLDLRSLRQAMVRPIIVDARNLLDSEAVADAGFDYYPTGRPPHRAAEVAEVISSA